MADDLDFPRLVYRGAPDELGAGEHVHPELGHIVGETARCDSADDWAAKQKQGWRLTREIAKSAAKDAAGDDDKKKGKK